MPEVDGNPAGGVPGASTPAQGQSSGEETGGMASLATELRQQKKAALDAKQTAATLKTSVLSAQAEWKKIQAELEVQKQARVSDAMRMAARVSSLEEELDDAATRAETVRGTQSKEWSFWRPMVAAAGAIALILLCVVSWRNIQTAEGGNAISDWWALQTAPVVAAQGESPPIESPPNNELPPDPHAALTTAIDQLDVALDEPNKLGLSPEEKLRRVTGSGQGCMMVWNDDLPSVLFGQEPLRRNSLASSLADCAQAVWRLH